MDKAVMAKMENSSLIEKLKVKKREVRELEQRAKSAESQVDFLRKELDNTLGDLSVERLHSAGFAEAIETNAQAVFKDFRRVYEELGPLFIRLS